MDETTGTVVSTQENSPQGSALEETRRSLRNLEARDWWLWGSAVTVLLLIASALIMMQLPALLHQRDLFESRQISNAVRALFALVAIFSCFAIYQQIAIKRLRNKMASQIGMMAALEARAEVFEKLAILDPLTGLFNRRFAVDHLPSEVARSERQGYPFTLLMIDLNKFKQINDVYGHAAGDLALREFAHALKKCVRSSDLPVRVGGDEFMVLLPECRAYSVPHALARLRGLQCEHNGIKIDLTFSAGWAEWRPGESTDELIERADAALYTDKRTGRAAEQVLKAAQDQQTGAKMKAVGELTGRVAHDFNNLMTVILGYSDLLLTAIAPEDPSRPQVESIRKAASQASQLTSQLLAFTKKQSTAPKILNLGKQVSEMEALIRPMLGERIALTFESDPELGDVQLASTQFDQIVMALVSNARDAMAGAGTIVISTSNSSIDEAFARSHPGARQGSYVKVSVLDSGPGMEPDVLKNIFNANAPITKESNKATRSALISVYGIVKQVGGYIMAESDGKNGSRFSVYFPRYTAPVQAKLPMPESSSDAQTVLVVESVDTLRELTCDFLKQEGFQVLQATNAADAIKLVDEYNQPIVLTLTDIVLPGTSCREMAKLLSDRHPEMKMLYMGGFGSAGASYEDIVHGPAFLESPFSADDLTHKIQELLSNAASAVAAITQ